MDQKKGSEHVSQQASVLLTCPCARHRVPSRLSFGSVRTRQAQIAFLKAAIQRCHCLPAAGSGHLCVIFSQLYSAHAVLVGHINSRRES